MKVQIQMIGPGGILDEVVITADDETDARISEAVAALARGVTWAVGDTLTITELPGDAEIVSQMHVASGLAK